AVQALARSLSKPVPSGRSGSIVDADFAVPGEDRWVDRTGQPVPGGSPSAVTLIYGSDGAPAVRLRFASPSDAGDLPVSLNAASPLALGTARLSAIPRARLLELRASQRRIVTASDRERRRIERDLHDGAQQRLVSAAFHLRVAANHVPEQAAILARAESEVVEGLDRLRRLSRGIFPASLATEGLDAALEQLADQAE